MTDRAKRVPSSNGEVPFSTEGALDTVADVLRRERKPLTLQSAQTVSRKFAVLGQCSKNHPLEVVMDLLAVPREFEDAALERDDVLVRMLEQKARCGEATAHSLSEVAEILPDSSKRKASRKKRLEKMLRRRAEARRWPARVGVLQGSKGPVLFLLEHVVGVPRENRQPVMAVEEPRPKTTNGDFARAFKEAFDRLRRDRPFNMVELAALRGALPHYSREQFDRGLFALRKSREFVLETFEGRHGSLSSEELAAAVREDGRVFAFAARRENG